MAHPIYKKNRHYLAARNKEIKYITSQRIELDLRYLLWVLGDIVMRVHDQIWACNLLLLSFCNNIRYRKSSSHRWDSQISIHIHINRSKSLFWGYYLWFINILSFLTLDDFSFFFNRDFFHSFENSILKGFIKL